MDRKEFIRKGFLGSAIFSATGLIGNVVHNNIDELKELEIIGFNHLPNTIIIIIRSVCTSAH